jgi:hypothetical protein
VLDNWFCAVSDAMLFRMLIAILFGSSSGDSCSGFEQSVQGVFDSESFQGLLPAHETGSL